MTTQIEQIKITSATDLFQSLSTDFQNQLWDSCPFSFGDCNHSLVHPNWVKGWILDMFDDEAQENEVNQLLVQLDELSESQVYIDLES
jgi:hypothetical protein